MTRPINALFPAAVLLAMLPSAAMADSIKLEEPETDDRIRLVAAEIRTAGEFYFNAPGNETVSHDVEAVAAFRFRERRLPPGGRDAPALRALREFDMATAHTQVGNHNSDLEVPADMRLIVSEGRREGVLHYCPQRPMSRDAVELLNIPGDPLSLTALLPQQAVEVGDDWSPSPCRSRRCSRNRRSRWGMTGPHPVGLRRCSQHWKRWNRRT